mmetsp:Transcript_32539/g.104132  ORF Transcript_32539/g.104132 Transcript_32539/m.104132 type:complete len:179 (+) Transcript_32539:743-1279(+)
MFVFSERAMRLGGLHPFLLSSGMGAAETAALAAWNGALLSRHGPQLYAPHDGEVELGTVALLYAGLTLVNAMHALVFFELLDRIGAVSSAVMKGVQLVLVFVFSVLFFCRYQASQCFSWPKAIGVATVVAGLLTYAAGSRDSRRQAERQRRCIYCEAPSTECVCTSTESTCILGARGV